MRFRRSFVSSILLMTSMLAACASTAVSGPGMTVHFGNAKKGKLIIMRDARTASGATFANPGGLSPSAEPLMRGKVMGAAPDGRSLPEWVEFSWIETEYPETVMETYEQLRARPVKVERVPIRSRIPADVVEEVTRSNQQRAKGKLAELSLWVYFIWYDSGIKFRWSLERGCCTVVRSGGDQFD